MQKPAESEYKPLTNEGYKHTLGDETEKSSPYDIPGVRRYTGNEQTVASQTTGENKFKIPGRESADEAMQEKTSSEDTQDFGIPGIKRYTNDAASQQKTEAFRQEEHKFKTIEELTQEDKNKNKAEQSTESRPSGLPGLDKFSNRKEQAEKTAQAAQKEQEVIPVFVPPAGAAGAAEAAGTAASLSGLPGLDKFSNRKEQAQAKVEEKQPPAEEVIDKTPMEDDPFGIPGIKHYTGMENVEKEAAAEITEDEDITEVVEASEAAEDNSVDERDLAQDEPADESLQEEEEEEVVQEPEIIKTKDRREKEYDELLAILGDDPESTIREVEDLTRELHKQIQKRDKAMADLLKLNDAAVRLSTLSSNKWPYKQRAIDASKERIDYLEADKLKLKRHLEMLESKIEEVCYEETPQAISDRIKAVDEEIEQLKLENDKQALAEELIQKKKLLDMSSGSDRSHIINDTSVYMKELTLGKYVQVKINDDLSGLSICDKDGQWFDTTKDRLSQATREQLYLALRISIADLFDEKSLIFPMFFDEALITWDKRRMKAVMRLLSKMSMHRQVIIFTCHDWLKDMIGEYLIDAKIIVM